LAENNIREGAPLATLEDVLVPLYLLHRYQVEAASKLLGMDYTFAMREMGRRRRRSSRRRNSGERCSGAGNTEARGAGAAGATAEDDSTRPPDYERGREHFKIRTSPAFDALAPAEAAAQHTLQFLFNPERAARLVEFHARNADNPGLQEVLGRHHWCDLENAAWRRLRGANRQCGGHGCSL